MEVLISSDSHSLSSPFRVHYLCYCDPYPINQYVLHSHFYGETSALGYKASTSVTNKQSNSREENGMSKRRLEKLSPDPELNTSSRHSGGPRLHAGASTTSARSVDSSPSCLITFGGAPRPQTSGSEDPTPNPNRFQIVCSAVVTQVREIRALRLSRSVGEKRPRLKGEQPEEPPSPLMVPSSAVSLHQIRHNSSRSR
ncbi:hypothetical protein F2Q68_00014861 [Brassica cretica]|uniref:Uncharacterized protein n=1 Tax=Brassica cretica TaxID=69181 RepID=A0A8S9HH80_BRACR|nr:hypothetical protein F2Q68_00014861 [Brassica cretica]